MNESLDIMETQFPSDEEGNIFLYDSLFSGSIDSTLQKQLASIYRTHDPSFNDDRKPLVQMQVTGYLLTAERSRSDIRSLVDSSSANERLKGIIAHAEDFHCSMNFVDLIFTNYLK